MPEDTPTPQPELGDTAKDKLVHAFDYPNGIVALCGFRDERTDAQWVTAVPANACPECLRLHRAKGGTQL